MSKNTTRAIIATSIATALTASLFASSADAAPRRHREPKVPQRVALTARDFGQRVPLTLDTGNYADQPASDGQYCDASGNGATGSEPRPIGGRQWNWLTRDQSTLIAEIVTVWKDAGAAFDDVVADTGYCRYGALGYPDFTHSVIFDGSTYVATWDGTVTMTTQVDRSLVSVSVTGSKPAGELSEQALDLLNRAIAKVDRANI